jgi:predicted RNA methylase
METLTPSYWRGKKVIELGTGTGFAAITAAVLGATDVTATDGDDR